MNTLKFLCCSFLFIALVTSGCKKDDDTSDKENYFFCKLNGEDWESESIGQPTVFRIVTGSIAAKRLDFFGNAPNGPQIAVLLQDYENADQGECISENEYYGTDDEKAGDNFMLPTGQSNFAQLSISGSGITRDGFVEITKCENGKVSGRFEFVVTDLLGEVTLTVSEGRFDNVAYVFSE